MAALPPGLVWIASWPKSGNTWMRLLLSNLLAGRDTPEDINDLTIHDGIASDRSLLEEEAAIDGSLLTGAEMWRLRPGVHDGVAAAARAARLMKVHDAFARLPDGTPALGRRARAAVYVVRDPRDVAVSWAFHYDCGLEEGVRALDGEDGGAAAQARGFAGRQFPYWLGDWSSHVAGWLDQTEIPVLAVRRPGRAGRGGGRLF